MDVEVRCTKASGRNSAAGAYLATRYDAASGFRPGDSECHIVRVSRPPGMDDDTVQLDALLSTRAWLTGL